MGRRLSPILRVLVGPYTPEVPGVQVSKVQKPLSSGAEGGEGPMGLGQGKIPTL